MSTFAWAAYLARAERFVEQATDEAVQRTAISRAYYAAYHAAASFVRTAGLLESGHTHRKVWGALAADRNPDRARAGLDGQVLLRMRVDADYRQRFPGDVGREAREAIIAGRTIIEALDRLS